MIVHILHCGIAYCGAGFPTDWKQLDLWVSVPEYLEGVCPPHLICGACVAAYEQQSAKGLINERQNGQGGDEAEKAV